MQDWQRLADVLLDAAGDRAEEQGHPMWVRVLDTAAGDPDDSFSLALSAESAGLLGWVATADCRAVGVVATGRLRPMECAAPDIVDPSADRIRMVCLVSRQGQTAWKMALPDGTASMQPPSEGRMLDCLRRCFGLPTPPPPASPARLQAAAWLAAILEQADGARRPLSWSEVSRLHPVARVLDGDLRGRCSTVLPGLIRLAGSAWTWEDFRLHAQQDPDGHDIIDPDLAAWMDAGMFARWVLSSLPAPDELLVALRPLLTPSAARRLAHAVHAATTPEPAAAST